MVDTRLSCLCTIQANFSGIRNNMEWEIWSNTKVSLKRSITQKSCIWETLNISTNAVSSTDTIQFVSDSWYFFYGRGTIFLSSIHFVWGSKKKFWSATIFFGNIRNIRNIGNIRNTFFDQRSPQHPEFSFWGWGSYNLGRITDPPFLIVSSQTNIRTTFYDQISPKHPEVGFCGGRGSKATLLTIS